MVVFPLMVVLIGLIPHLVQGIAQHGIGHILLVHRLGRRLGSRFLIGFLIFVRKGRGRFFGVGLVGLLRGRCQSQHHQQQAPDQDTPAAHHAGKHPGFRVVPLYHLSAPLSARFGRGSLRNVSSMYFRHGASNDAVSQGFPPHYLLGFAGVPSSILSTSAAARRTVASLWFSNRRTAGSALLSPIRPNARTAAFGMASSLSSKVAIRAGTALLSPILPRAFADCSRTSSLSSFKAAISAGTAAG